MRCKLIFTALVFTALLAPAAFAADEEMAQIVTQVALPVQCISRVAVRKIDGKEKFVSPQGFKLEPGRHTLSGTVAVNRRNCPVLRGQDDWTAAPLEADFEAGKTYYIGFDHSSDNRADWKYVIWKVE